MSRAGADTLVEKSRVVGRPSIRTKALSRHHAACDFFLPRDDSEFSVEGNRQLPDVSSAIGPVDQA